MPIHHALWRVGAHPERLTGSQLGEKRLEDMIVAQPEVLSSDWMLIARQVRTAFGGIIDLLAVAPDGSLVLIEIKRGLTPRDVVAQALDYASWVKGLEITEISALYAGYDRRSAKVPQLRSGSRHGRIRGPGRVARHQAGVRGGP